MRTYYQHNAPGPDWELIEFAPEPEAERPYVVEESELSDVAAERMRIACAVYTEPREG